MIHGDATQSNVVIDDDGTFRLVDFAIAYEDALLADVASALWRNGRSGPNAVSYDRAPPISCTDTPPSDRSRHRQDERSWFT